MVSGHYFLPHTHTTLLYTLYSTQRDSHLTNYKKRVVYGGGGDSARARVGVFLWGGRGDEKKTIFVKNHYFK